VISGYLKNRGMGTMILVLAVVLWAFGKPHPARQALTLKNRDFVQAARATGESTTRIVFAEIVPNMIAGSRQRSSSSSTSPCSLTRVSNS
jgi:ABC-type dipeptide/oligopeptide/nickel transport system permease subunit